MKKNALGRLEEQEPLPDHSQICGAFIWHKTKDHDLTVVAPALVEITELAKPPTFNFQPTYESCDLLSQLNKQFHQSRLAAGTTKSTDNDVMSYEVWVLHHLLTLFSAAE